MNITVRNQIRASDVDRRIISSKTFQNRKLWIRNFTGTHKIFKIVCIDRRKYIRRRKIVQMKASHRRYTHIWHICLPMQKFL